MRSLIIAAALALGGCSAAKGYQCDANGLYIVPRGDSSAEATQAIARNTDLLNRRTKWLAGELPHASAESVASAEGCPPGVAARPRDPELDRAVARQVDDLENMADNVASSGSSSGR
jgi:hypothetical protein